MGKGKKNMLWKCELEKNSGEDVNKEKFDYGMVVCITVDCIINQF